MRVFFCGTRPEKSDKKLVYIILSPPLGRTNRGLGSKRWEKIDKFIPTYLT